MKKPTKQELRWVAEAITHYLFDHLADPQSPPDRHKRTVLANFAYETEKAAAEMAAAEMKETESGPEPALGPEPEPEDEVKAEVEAKAEIDKKKTKVRHR